MFTFTCPNYAEWLPPSPNDRVSFFGLTWDLLLGKACRPDGSGGWREGRIFTKPHSWSEGPLKQLQLSLTWLTVKWVTVRRGVRMRRQGGRKGRKGGVSSVRSGWHHHMSKEEWFRRSREGGSTRIQRGKEKSGSERWAHAQGYSQK